MNRSLKLAFAALAAAGALVACGRSPELIDKTGPDFIKKSDLTDGTWYYVETMVDAPPTTAAAAAGFGTGLEKIRFEVQENYLVAYRSYEKVPGIDPLVDRQKSTIGHVVFQDGRPYRGAPVGAWKITKQFDRQRQYNAATGEQTNILEENTSDRPWYQRDYIRVNWSDNEIINFGSGTYTGNQFQWNGMLQYVSDGDTQNTPEDGAVWDYGVDASGKKNLNYFDLTVRALMNPDQVYYDGYGYIPYCWLNPSVDCEPQQVKIRVAFKKVDEAHVDDFEPLAYNENLMTKFGFFREERITYDRNRGGTDDGRVFFADHHDIWQRAHDQGGNLIPVAQRDLKPIVYFLSPNFPPELLPGAKNLEASWDFAFRRAVAVPRGIEPKDVPQMFYVCTSPVKDGDPAACGKVGTNGGRMGDIRFNQIPWIDQYQIAGPLGLGPAYTDPETGEIVAGVANIYGGNMDYTYVGLSNEIIDVLNGDLSIADLIAGKDKQGYVFDHLNATDPRRPLSGPWQSQQGLISDPQKPLGSYAQPTGQLQAIINSAKLDGHLPLFREDRRAVVDQLLASSPTISNEMINEPEMRAGVLAMAPAGDFRNRLQTDANLYAKFARQVALGTDPFTAKNKERLYKAEHMPGHGCLLLSEFFDDTYLGLAKQMAKKFNAKVTDLEANGNPACASKTACTLDEAKKLAHDYIYLQLRNAAFEAIAEHEVGHTVGLTHNFGGSFDALNYKDGYWDLRKDTIGVLVGGKRVLPVTAQNMLDASKPNQMQIDNSMAEYQYSTIMDYGSRLNSDIRGIGKYDNAAILFAYSGGGEPGYVEVFNNYRRDMSNPNVGIDTDNTMKQLVVRGAQTEIPYINATHYTPVSWMLSDRYHYTTLPFFFADAPDQSDPKAFGKALDQGISRMMDRGYKKWSELEPLYKQISDAAHQFDMNEGGFSTANWDVAKQIVNKVAPGGMPVEVPYMFCDDSVVGANPVCNRWDFGADVYEMTNDWITRNKEYYVFDNFRRDRLGGVWNPMAVIQRKFSRGMENLPNVYQQWLYNIYWAQSYYDLEADQMEQYFGVGDPIWQNYWTMAVVDSTNYALDTMATPSAGYFGKLQNGNWIHLSENRPDNARYVETNGQPGALEAAFIQSVKDKYAQNTNPVTDVVYVPRGPGREMYTLYDDSGYNFFTRTNEVGHFWDQYMTLWLLTSNETAFLGVDRGADALKYSIPYYLTFSKELNQVTMNLWSENRDGYANYLVKTGNGEATVLARPWVHAENYLRGFNYPPPPTSPVDANGTALPLEKVEPSPSWGTKFYTELYGMAFFSANFQMDFVNGNKVFRMGSGEALTPSSGYEVVTFNDPQSGQVYGSLHKIGDTNPPAGPLTVMNAAVWAQNAKDAAAAPNHTKDGLTDVQWNAKVQEAVRSLELMRGFTNIFNQAI